MSYTLALAGLAALASGAAVHTERSADQCCFGINVSGNGVNGALGQLSDGQNRVGPGQSPKPAQYCISGSTITDGSGRGCILTPPTTQFQCDQGASPTPGFAVGSNGQITHNGDSTFYACPVDDNGNYNIYTEPLDNMPKCVEVMLSSANGACAAPKVTTKYQPTTVPVYKTETVTSQCPPAQTSTETKEVYKTKTETSVITSTVQSQCPAPQTVTVTSVHTVMPQPPVQTTVVKQTPTQAISGPAPSNTKGQGQGQCPLNLPDMSSYQYPHLIVPVDSSAPNKASGTSYNGKVSSSVSSIFNFDIPGSYAGKTCNVVFSLPQQSQLTTSSFTSTPPSGGKLDVSSLKAPATQGTSFSNKPGVEKDLSKLEVAPGNAYTVASAPCAAGTTQSYEIASENGYALEWFQDYNPCPIGLYVVATD